MNCTELGIISDTERPIIPSILSPLKFSLENPMPPATLKLQQVPTHAELS
jgi:hypothetical protein